MIALKPENVVDVLFGNRLRQLLDERNISQAHFADRIGVSRSRMHNYVAQRSEPDYATLIRIANTLDTSIDFLLGKSEHQGLPQTACLSGFPDFIPSRGAGGEPPDPSCWIPLYGSQYKAPEPDAAPAAPSDPGRTDGQAPSPSNPLGWIRHETPHQASNYRKCYAILVKDDTMKPYLLPGDVAYIQPMVIFHNCLSSSPTSDIYAVRLHEGDAVGVSLKKCYSRGNLLVFFCENSLYSPYILHMTRIRFSPIIGKVVCVWRSCMGNAISDSIEHLSLEDREPPHR